MLFGFGVRRSFLFVLTYVYIDLVAPQRLTYWMLNSVPVSLIAVVLAVGSWAIIDDKRGIKFTPRQALMFLLLIYCGMTTLTADFPVEAAAKWSWVWKALAFAIFLPVTLRTRLRIESIVLFMILSAASIIIVGGIKTLASGGGYGTLNLMVATNTGLYESSTISAVSIAIIPIILFLMKYGTIYPPDKRVTLFGYALIFACLLIPVGTEARTGMICIAILALLMLRQTKRRFLYLSLLGAVAVIGMPLLPASFTGRMDSIKEYKADSSASTRIAVWKWTWGYVQDHPFGGGFNAYMQNTIRYTTTKTEGDGAQIEEKGTLVLDRARAYHSAYFEMLGEQGYPGLALWLMIHFTGLFRMEALRRRYLKKGAANEEWIGVLATALQHAHIIFLAASLFVGIAFQPFVYMLVGVQIGLDTYARSLRESAKDPPVFGQRQALA